MTLSSDPLVCVEDKSVLTMSLFLCDITSSRPLRPIARLHFLTTRDLVHDNVKMSVMLSLRCITFRSVL